MINLNKNICFLSKDGIYNNNKNAQVDVILSPYYYWYFEKKLPIRDIKKARKMLPQMIASSLPQKSFEYVVVQDKEDKNNFHIFAVDVSLIKEKLRVLKIDFTTIANISFFHLEFDSIVIELNDSIIVKDLNSVFEVSKDKIDENYLDKEEIETVLENKKSLIFKHRLGNTNLMYKSIDFFESNFVALSVVSILLLSAIVIDVYGNYRLKSIYEKKASLLMSSQKYAEHQVQLKYIVDSLLDLDAQQKMFRMDLNNILSAKYDKNSFFTTIEYDDSYWFIKIKAPSKELSDKLVVSKGFKFFNEDKNNFTYEKNR